MVIIKRKMMLKTKQVARRVNMGSKMHKMGTKIKGSRKGIWSFREETKNRRVGNWVLYIRSVAALKVLFWREARWFLGLSVAVGWGWPFKPQKNQTVSLNRTEPNIQRIQNLWKDKWWCEVKKICGVGPCNMQSR